MLSTHEHRRGEFGALCPRQDQEQAPHGTFATQLNTNKEMHMSRILKSRRVKILVATVAALGITVVAVAYWTQDGSGNGTAGVGSTATSNLVLTDESGVTGLAPGAAAQQLSGTVENTNDGAITVGTVTATVTGTDKDGCTADDFAISGDPVAVGHLDGGASGSFSGESIAMVDRDANQDACKDATVNIDYTINTPVS